MYEAIARLIGSFITCYSCTVLITSKLLNKNEYFKIINLIIIICVIPVLKAVGSLMMAYKIICVIGIYTIVIKLIYKKGFLLSLILCIFAYSIGFLCDAINSLIYLKIFRIDVAYIQEHLFLTYIMHFTFFIISLIISMFIKTESFFNEIEDMILKKDLNSVFNYIIFFITFMSVLGYIVSVQPYLSLQHILSVAALAIFIVMNITYFRQIKISTKSKYDYDNIYDYTNEMEKMAKQLIKQEHEYKNRLLGIEALIENEQYADAIDFIQNILNYKSADNILMMANYDKIHDAVLKKILINKTCEAVNEGIVVYTDIRSEVDDIAVSKLELNDVISIIMDNAIEASKDARENTINIMIDEESDGISIIIANTYPDRYVDIELYKEGNSAKGKYRGSGLSILKQIEENNSQLTIDTAVTDELFIQEIHICKAKETI